jgi:uncharacterized protein (TIGR00255 family)
MTGFGRSEGASSTCKWAWEARSVNGRGLDVRMRLPAGCEGIEPILREAVAKRFQRGNISATLTVERQSVGTHVQLNEAVFAEVLNAAGRAAQIAGGAIPDTATLLSIKGVLEQTDAVEEPEVRATREKTVIAGFDDVLDRLATARLSEGQKLGAIIAGQVNEIERLTNEVRGAPSRSVDAIRTRIKDLLARITDVETTFDKERLHQEAVLIATRVDVEEELARLTAHVAAAREILAEGGAVGRRLDFLAQEFNREANTLCSKANAVDVTRHGLALKTVIDQLREQVQNVE